jgi:hypothetical protein
MPKLLSYYSSYGNNYLYDMDSYDLNSDNMTALTLKHPSYIMNLTCSSRLTMMPLKSLSTRLSQELVVTSTWVTKQAPPGNPYPMAHFCAIQQYSNMWSLLWLKPNLVHFLSMQKKGPSYAQHFLKWITNRMPHNSKLTTPHHMELSIT